MMMDKSEAFGRWYTEGREAGFLGRAWCATHESPPEDEEELWGELSCRVVVHLFEPETEDERRERVDRHCTRTGCDRPGTETVDGQWYCHLHGARLWRIKYRLGLLSGPEVRP